MSAHTRTEGEIKAQKEKRHRRYASSVDYLTSQKPSGVSEV